MLRLKRKENMTFLEHFKGFSLTGRVGEGAHSDKG